MKNSEKAIAKCNKKAWQDIKNIQNAPNMVCAESLINDALAKTFGLWNEGMLVIRMRKLGQMGQAEYAVRLHRENWNRYVSTVKSYLIEKIPARLHTSMMYQRMVGYIN